MTRAFFILLTRCYLPSQTHIKYKYTNNLIFYQLTNYSSATDCSVPDKSENVVCATVQGLVEQRQEYK